MVFWCAGFVDPLEDIEQAEFSDAGEDLQDAFSYELFLLDLFGLFGSGIKIHKDKIFTVVYGFVYCHAAADIVEEGLEPGLIFFEPVFGKIPAGGGILGFGLFRIHIRYGSALIKSTHIIKLLFGYWPDISNEAAT